MSYTHLLYHIVFGTKGHVPLIADAWEGELHEFLGRIVRDHGGEAVAINGMPDHVHLLVRLEPVEGVADLLRELKSGSSKWVRRHHLPGFNWQARYAAFTVSESGSGRLRKYIREQKKHHEMQSFETEYTKLLRRHGIDFDEQYLWD